MNDLAPYAPMIAVRVIALLLFAGTFAKGCENIIGGRYYWAGLWFGLSVVFGAALADYAAP